MHKIITIHYTPDFKKAYQKLPKEIQKAVDKKDKQFRENPYYPSLQTHKLGGPLHDLWSFFVTKSYRVLFEFLNGDAAIFYDVGTHDVYK
ncbi:MAG: type II toxin-antitoxin system mRNA interferase toxin, RelE/StbE family [Nanoarchaeota archaeon]